MCTAHISRPATGAYLWQTPSGPPPSYLTRFDVEQALLDRHDARETLALLPVLRALRHPRRRSDYELYLRK